MIRPRYQNNKNFDIFFKKNIVAVGWSDFSFKNYDNIEDLFQKMGYLKNIAPTTAGKWKNQIRRFKHLKIDDRIIIPYYNSICLAIVQGEEIYCKDDYEYDQSNQRIVQYLRKDDNLVFIPRNSLSERLQRRLRVRGNTIADLWEFSSELDMLFKQVKDNNSTYKWTTIISEKENIEIVKFKKELLKNIQGGKTNLQTGGIGLEKLISELLQIEGYSTHIPSKRLFPSFADADIIAQRTDRISEIDLLVQIKHHRGITNAWGAKQLLEIIKELPDKYKNYRLVMLTSAKASKDLIEICEKEDIVLFDGEELAEWIYDSLPNLKPETKMLLGIGVIPKLMID